MTHADRPAAAPFADVALDPEQAENILDRLHEADDLVRRAGSDTRFLAQVRSPGDDPASRGYNAQLTRSFATGMAHLDEETAFLRDFIEKVGESIGRLRGQDAAAAEDITSSRPGSPG